MNHDTILRIDELERLWPVMKNKLIFYDKMIDTIQDLQCKADLHEKKSLEDYSSLLEKITSLDAKNDAYLKKLEARIDEMFKVQVNLGLAVNNHGDAIDNLKSLINGINSHLDAISQIQQLSCHKDDLASLEISHENFKVDSLKMHENLNNLLQLRMDKNRDKLQMLEESLDKLRKDVSFCISEENFLKQNLEDLDSRKQNLKSVLEKRFQELTDKFNLIIDDKIKAIPEPVIPSLEEAKSYMEKQLEPVSLDAKNANLRSVNTDTKLHILEKKVEQIKLTIDHITLGA